MDLVNRRQARRRSIQKATVIDRLRATLVAVAGETAYISIVDAQGLESQAECAASWLSEEDIEDGDNFEIVINSDGSRFWPSIVVHKAEELSESQWRELHDIVAEVPGSSGLNASNWQEFRNKPLAIDISDE